jgi:hypothetical protein
VENVPLEQVRHVEIWGLDCLDLMADRGAGVWRPSLGIGNGMDLDWNQVAWMDRAYQSWKTGKDNCDGASGRTGFDSSFSFATRHSSIYEAVSSQHSLEHPGATNSDVWSTRQGHLEKSNTTSFRNDGMKSEGVLRAIASHSQLISSKTPEPHNVTEQTCKQDHVKYQRARCQQTSSLSAIAEFQYYWDMRETLFRCHQS